jgi:hypothetical protein
MQGETPKDRSNSSNWGERPPPKKKKKKNLKNEKIATL